MGVLRSEIVSDRRQQRNEAVAPIGQGENTKFVENILSVGGGGEEPIEVLLIDPLGEESDNSEEVACTLV